MDYYRIIIQSVKMNSLVYQLQTNHYETRNEPILKLEFVL